MKQNKEKKNKNKKKIVKLFKKHLQEENKSK